MFSNLANGLGLALVFPHRRLSFRISPGYLWVILLWYLVSYWFFDYLAVEPPRLFSVSGILTPCVYTLLSLFAGYLLSRIVGVQTLAIAFPIVFLNACWWNFLLWEFTREWFVSVESFEGQVLAQVSVPLWFLLISYRAINMCLGNRPGVKKVSGIGAVLLAGVFHLYPDYVYTDRFYVADPELSSEDWLAELDPGSPGPGAEPVQPTFDAEAVLTRQGTLIENAANDLRPSRPGKRDLFFVGYAPWGEQKVFRNETQFAQELFARDLGLHGHSIVLNNWRDQGPEQPLAIKSNLRYVLQRMGALAQPEEDVLFLYITSHGTEDHYLATALGNLPLNDLSARELKELLEESRFRWRIIVVSACYSGGFIPFLKNNYSIVISAARHDRASFGCSDDADFTFFGRAYLVNALAEGKDFIEAFSAAKQQVSEWEIAEEFTPSEPQIYIGESIAEYLGLKRMLDAE